MRRLVTALLAPLLAIILIGALAPVGASAQDIRVDSGMGPDGPGTGRPPSHRQRPPFVHRRRVPVWISPFEASVASMCW